MRRLKEKENEENIWRRKIVTEGHNFLVMGYLFTGDSLDRQIDHRIYIFTSTGFKERAQIWFLTLSRLPERLNQLE